MALQTDGRIVVAGSGGSGGTSDFAFVRYKADGTLDLSFDSDGMVTTDINASMDWANALVVQSNGKIVVAGTTSSDDGSYFAVSRYEGTPVTADLLYTLFSGNTTKLPTDGTFGYSVALAGNYVVVGEVADSGTAFVYDLSSPTPITPITTLINPNPLSGDQFGYSVAVSSLWRTVR